MSRLLVVPGIAALGVGAAVVSLNAAHSDPAYSFAGQSATGDAALLGAGWAMITGAIVLWWRGRHRRFGSLLAAAGLAWFLLEWDNPAIGSAAAFTAGLVLYAACPPLVAQVALAYPNERRRSLVERGVVAAGFLIAVLMLGLLPATLSDPVAAGCSACPRNLALVSERPELAEELTRVGVYAGLGWAIAAALLAGRRVLTASAATRRAGGAVAAAGGAYLGLVAAWFAASLDEGLLANGTLERRLWLGQAAALVALVGAVSWTWVRAWKSRRAVARIVVDLAQAPPAGGLRDSLAEVVADPELVLAYPVGDSGRLVDAHGLPVDLSAQHQRTSLVRNGRPVAVLGHRRGLLDDEQLVEELAATARLALENERLQAEVRARVDELRSSRARIVEAGDAERKRLERDLHDGAQQQLVALSLSLRLLRSQLGSDGAGDARARIEEAEAELNTAIAELREVAHGIFPAVLADEGFAAAVGALREEAHVPIRILHLPDERCAPRTEAAAYAVVAAAARAATDTLSVAADRTGGALLLEVETSDTGLDLVELEDRVGALDGRLNVERDEGGRVRIRAELPCAS